MKTNKRAAVAWSLSSALCVALSGCGKTDKPISAAAAPPKPKEAASQIQQAFTTASPEIKKNAEAVSEAMRTADYEQAIQTLETLKARQNLTLEQGTALYNSERALVAKLLAGIEAGDPKAKRAYEMLKQTHRN